MSENIRYFNTLRNGGEDPADPNPPPSPKDTKPNPKRHPNSKLTAIWEREK